MATALVRGAVAQLELGIQRNFELDRNFHKGGRSFYFFDFDDNIATLNTPAYLFKKDTGKRLKITSAEFVRNSEQISHSGLYADYEVRFDDKAGSFQAFRDKDMNWIERLFRRKQPFIKDLSAALGLPEVEWKGPSWSCFYHAVFNQRPTAIITARGHEPETLKQGFTKMRDSGFLPCEPNYLSLFPVNNPKIREELSGGQKKNTAELKQAAIRASVEQALKSYGESPYHRFGMSDDDPENIRLIIEEMARLKAEWPDMGFFVIDTHEGQFVKREVFRHHTEDQPLKSSEQLSLI